MVARKSHFVLKFWNLVGQAQIIFMKTIWDLTTSAKPTGSRVTASITILAKSLVFHLLKVTVAAKFQSFKGVQMKTKIQFKK
jgi:hypothetical protein